MVDQGVEGQAGVDWAEANQVAEDQGVEGQAGVGWEAEDQVAEDQEVDLAEAGREVVGQLAEDQVVEDLELQWAHRVSTRSAAMLSQRSLTIVMCKDSILHNRPCSTLCTLATTAATALRNCLALCHRATFLA